MIIGIDLDGTVIEDGPYDADAPMHLMPGAKEALRALKAADHILVLVSARANRALLFNPMLDPLVRAGVRRMNVALWAKERETHLARYRQMLDFVARELPGVFDAVDDGACGKLDVDLMLDDKAVRIGRGLSAMSWADVARFYGAPAYEEVPRGA